MIGLKNRMRIYKLEKASLVLKVLKANILDIKSLNNFNFNGVQKDCRK